MMSDLVTLNLISPWFLSENNQSNNLNQPTNNNKKKSTTPKQIFVLVKLVLSKNAKPIALFVCP